MTKTLFTLSSSSLSDTKKIASEIVKYISPGSFVALNGNLGAGKTQLVKYISEQYGVESVSSPTFAIVNEYNGTVKIYHFDFYRIKNENELIELGWFDYINDENAIIFTEWADLFPSLIPASCYSININHDNPKNRIITLEKIE